MSTLERAIAIAATAHAGQMDKAGQPYILHPIRVMLRVQSEYERTHPNQSMSEMYREFHSPI